MKIVTILGARPQFIKAAMISKVISTHSNINETTIHTGQHFDTNMSQIFFDEMGCPFPKTIGHDGPDIMRVLQA